MLAFPSPSAAYCLPLPLQRVVCIWWLTRRFNSFDKQKWWIVQVAEWVHFNIPCLSAASLGLLFNRTQWVAVGVMEIWLHCPFGCYMHRAIAREGLWIIHKKWALKSHQRKHSMKVLIKSSFHFHLFLNWTWNFLIKYLYVGGSRRVVFGKSLPGLCSNDCVVWVWGSVSNME